MGRSGSRAVSPDERLGMIEQAATEQFARQGYSTTTVDDIVNAAGLTKPMLYRHFESKRELYIHLVRRHRDELAAAPLSVYSRDVGNPQGQITSMIEVWLDHTRAHPDATRLLFMPMRDEPEVEEAQHEMYTLQRNTLVGLLRGLAPVELDDAHAEPMAEVTRTSLAAMALWWIDHPATPRQVLVTVLAGMVEGLLGIEHAHPQLTEIRR